MTLLVIDTSGPVCGTAVLEGDRVLCEMTVQNKNTHSVSLMPMIDAALSSAGKTLSDMDALCAVTGPGSFTGVRIGAATLKGLAHGSGKECIGVDALEALSRSAGVWDGLICPIQDARAGQVYGAAFRQGERVMEDRAERLEDYILSARELAGGERMLFCGDGVRVHRERIAELLGEQAVFAPPQLCYLRPSAAGFLAMEKGKKTDYLHFRESYLRPPNAEKNRKLLEAMGHE